MVEKTLAEQLVDAGIAEYVDDDARKAIQKGRAEGTGRKRTKVVVAEDEDDGYHTKDA